MLLECYNVGHDSEVHAGKDLGGMSLLSHGYLVLMGGGEDGQNMGKVGSELFGERNHVLE